MKAYTADIQSTSTSTISPAAVTALFVNDNAFSLESLCEYTSLKRLYIKETSREALDLSGVELPTTLQSIAITNNKKLTQLLLAFTKRTEVESLQIVGNPLTRIEIDVEYVPNLKRLVIRNNVIFHLEANLAKLPIEYIDLSANQLSMLDPDLLRSPTLQSIILYDNNLADIGDIFPDEPNHLQSIDLGKNKLTDFAFCPANNSVEALRR